MALSRNIAGSKKDDYSRWDTRRRLVAEMNFMRKSSSVVIGETLNQIIQRISAGNKGFEEMEIDEQLREIANLIENLLKENGEFIRLDYSRVTLEYIDDETVKRLRKQLQCFRHSSNESLDERVRFSKEQKEFLIDFGATICRAIWASRN